VRCYLAGPMSGRDNLNFPCFDSAAAYLKAMGHDVVNPADIDRSMGVDPSKYSALTEVPESLRQDALARDFLELCTCDAIALLPEWDTSRSAKAERFVAEQIGLAVVHVVPWLSFKPEVAPIIVGLSGAAQSGKDSSGTRFVERWGFERIAFADSLKAVALACNPDLVAPVKLRGWEDVKRHMPASRIFLQHLGGAVRDHVDSDAWINAAFRKTTPGGRYVICDVRYPNEFDAIKARGGYVVRVERPGVGPANGHISETALDGHDFDAYLKNNGTLEQLWGRVDILVRTMPEFG
jgi:hypothetical protein